MILAAMKTFQVIAMSLFWLFLFIYYYYFLLTPNSCMSVEINHLLDVMSLLDKIWGRKFIHNIKCIYFHFMYCITILVHILI